MKDNYDEKEQKDPFDWSNVSEDDNCWNPYSQIVLSNTKNEKEDKKNVITHNNELNDKQAENNGLYGSDKEFLQQQFNFIKRHSNSMAIKPFQCCNKSSEEIYINDYKIINYDLI